MTLCVLSVAALALPTAGVVGQEPNPDPLPIDRAKQRAIELTGQASAPFLLIPEYSTVKVMPDRAAFTGMPGEPLRIDLARGETEAGQIIVAPLSQNLVDVSFAVSELRGPGGALLPESARSLDVVGYVRTDSTVDLSYPVDRKGWFPDPILPYVKRFDVDRDKVQSLWLSVTAPLSQAPGLYTGQVTVTPGNAEPRTIPVRVRVFAFALPRERSLRTTVGVFTRYLSKIHGDAWSEELWWKYADFLLAHRIDMDNPYREGGPPPSVERIERLVDGGQQRWGLRYIRQPGEGWSSVGPEASEYEAYLDRAIGQAKERLAVLEEAGAADLAYIYLYDEVRERHWPKLLETSRRVREELPGVPILTSAFDINLGAVSGLDEVIDEWVVILPHFNRPGPRAEIDRARADGEIVHWYTAIWPPRPYPNFFIEYDAIEARLLMGAMARKYGPDGFGYWALNLSFATDGQRPLTRGPYTEWDPLAFGPSNGEGSWIYAGEDGPITSIRFENIRDGLEDFEFYQLLEDAIAQAEARGVPTGELQPARDLLAVPDYLVRTLTDFTREAEVLAHHRTKTAEAIESLNR